MAVYIWASYQSSLRKTSDSGKAPRCAAAFISEPSRQQNSTIKLLLIHGGEEMNERRGRFCFRSMRVFSVDYGHLIKHRNTARISGKAERMWRGEQRRSCTWSGPRAARRRPSLSSQRGGAESERRTHHFSTNGNERSFSWVQKNVKKYQWACLNEADRRSEQHTLQNHKQI